MKKHLIAAAVAGALAVPAMAQVTVSGTLDVQAYNSRDTERVATGAALTTRASVDDTGSEGVSSDTGNALDGWSTSQLVFTATEDLGGGLKATAVWSQRMSNTTFGARDRSIQLDGGFGSVRMGRFNPSITAGYLGISGLGTTGNAGTVYNFVLDGGADQFSASGLAFASGNFERQDNLIQYTSPNMSGVVGTVGYATSSTDTSATAGKTDETQMHGTLAYSAGPISVAAGYGTRENEAEGTEGSAESKLTWVGAAYNFGVAAVNLTYATRDQDIANVSVHDAKLTTAALTVPMGAITLRASFYQGDDSGRVGGGNAVEFDGHQISATYALGKRTLAYLVYGENDKARDGAASTAAEYNRKQTGLGISHSF